VLEQTDTGFAITRIELEVAGVVAGIDEAAFVALAEQAEATCPVSRALAGTEITLAARLVSSDIDSLSNQREAS
jgi:osmotically inducible protein OsmC